MFRKLVVVVFVILLFLVIGILSYYSLQSEAIGGKSVDCGIFIEDQSSRFNFSIEDNQKWKNYHDRILPCDKGAISIFSPVGGEIDELKRLTIVLTDEEYSGKRVWNDTETFIYSNYDFSEDGNFMYYYVSPHGYDPTYVEDLSQRIGIVINYILVNLTLENKETKSLNYEEWDTSRRNLVDLGIKLEIVK